jgi:hypothetical protein
MNPADLRARADREELVYSANELAKMLRAAAEAMEERDGLRSLIGKYIKTVEYAEGVNFIEYGPYLSDWDIAVLLAIAGEPK